MVSKLVSGDQYVMTNVDKCLLQTKSNNCQATNRDLHESCPRENGVVAVTAVLGVCPCYTAVCVCLLHLYVCVYYTRGGDIVGSCAPAPEQRLGIGWRRVLLLEHVTKTLSVWTGSLVRFRQRGVQISQILKEETMTIIAVNLVWYWQIHWIATAYYCLSRLLP